MSTASQERFLAWFRAKRDEVLAQSKLPADHAGLIGSHREQVVRTLLDGLLPERLSVGRGVVYSALDRSRECDGVVWDSANFPKLPMFEHSAFLAESVAAVLEVKSRFSAAEFRKCRDATEQLMRVGMMAGHGDIQLRTEAHLKSLEYRVHALEAGQLSAGAIFSDPRIPYVLVVLRGGQRVNIETLIGDDDHDLGENFPEVTCFVEEGVLVRRWEPNALELDDGERPLIALYDYGNDVLAFLANEILRLVRVRTPSFTALWDLSAYLEFIPRAAVEQRTYEMRRFPHGARPAGFEPRAAD